MLYHFFLCMIFSTTFLLSSDDIKQGKQVRSSVSLVMRNHLRNRIIKTDFLRKQWDLWQEHRRESLKINKDSNEQLKVIGSQFWQERNAILAQRR